MAKPNNSPEIVTERILAYMAELGLAASAEVRAEVAARVAGHENVAEEKTRHALTSIFRVYRLNLDDVTADFTLQLTETFKQPVSWVTESLEAAQAYASNRAKEFDSVFVVVNGAFELVGTFDEAPKEIEGYNVVSTLDTVKNLKPKTVSDTEASDFDLVDAELYTLRYAVARAKQNVAASRQSSGKDWEGRLIFVTLGHQRNILWSMPY